MQSLLLLTSLVQLRSPPPLSVPSPCPLARHACVADEKCQAFGVFNNRYELHGCADPAALVPNNDWTIYVPNGTEANGWKALHEHMNVDESKCASHPRDGTSTGDCSSPPPPSYPYEALGSVDVGTGESSIFMFNSTRYLLDNIFCGWIDHFGQYPFVRLSPLGCQRRHDRSRLLLDHARQQRWSHTHTSSSSHRAMECNICRAFVRTDS